MDNIEITQSSLFEEYLKQEKNEDKVFHRPSNHTRREIKSTPVLIVIASILLLGTGGWFIYNNIYIPYKIDKEAPRYYTFSKGTNLRSSQLVGVDDNILQTLPYGTELITYENDNDWGHVKAAGKKGFISSFYILPKEDFLLLNAVFGDIESRECISTAKCKLAILDYLKRNNFNTGTAGWQVYTRAEDIKPNAVFYPRFYDKNSKFTDFAFLIKNNGTGERRLAYYSFLEDETPVFRFEEPAPETGYIKDMGVRGYKVVTSYTY